MDKNKKNEEISALFILMLSYKNSKHFKELLVKYNLSNKILTDKINRIYAKYSKDGVFKITQAEINREMRVIVAEVNNMKKEISSTEKVVLLTMLENAFKTTYRDINKKLGLDKKATTKETNQVVNKKTNQVVNKKTKDINTSERVEKNKAKLSQKLIIDIKQQLKKEVSIDVINKSINTTFIQGVKVSERLIETELARVTNEAIIQSYKDNDITRVRYNSTLEKNTCSVCESLDGIIFDINNAPSLPLHPRCMCWYEIE